MKEPVQTRLLLGPSGTGKTFQCLEEVRTELRKTPFGPPLIFIAPQQATYQVERQLLADGPLQGYSRLHVLSFEDLALHLLRQLRTEAPRLLGEDGRLMVLRALLAIKRDDLKLFRATARLRGFAQQLSGVLREFQHFQLAPEDLVELSRKIDNVQLQWKLHDLALLLRAYTGWLDGHKIHDADELLGMVAKWLAGSGSGAAHPNTQPPSCTPLHPLRFAALWMDGFAELTPAEMELLSALLPFCDRATLAFNLDAQGEAAVSWVSTWSLVNRTCQDLKNRLLQSPGVELSVDLLSRDHPQTRFAKNNVLKHLEACWAHPREFQESASKSEAALRVFQCATPEAEMRLAARAILRAVRSGARYGEIAVMVRDLERYHASARRIFNRYEIPFFLDRREPIGHHPLLELTRSALRTAAFKWQTEDWFGALKSGLVQEDEASLDRLENEAVARGWNGEDWLLPLKLEHEPQLAQWLEPLRARVVTPFRELETELGSHPSGMLLASALRTFWAKLQVAEQLEQWSASAALQGASLSDAVHKAVWEKVQDWVENLELAFGSHSMSLREWMPILDSGFASQSAGVIPPALDQVLVGAIDRSRNPDLRWIFILGLNEGVFPAPVEDPTLLTGSEREHLTFLGARLGPSVRHRLAREQYLGYIACTRAREQVVLTYALADENDRKLSPSPFLDHLRVLFPKLEVERGDADLSPETGEHVADLIEQLRWNEESNSFIGPIPAAIEKLPLISGLRHRCEQFTTAAGQSPLPVALNEALYGRILETSVSRLEEYASCPFQFFVTSGLRAEERTTFRLDARQRGSFQHEVLSRFHQELKREQKRWRDLDSHEAKKRIAHIVDTLAVEYEEGLLRATEEGQFAAQSLSESLQTFMSTLIEWMPQYQFDPHSVELAFGIEEKPLPAWEVDLGEGHWLSFRGKIDRIDLCGRPGTDEAYCVVIDYKSSLRQLDPVFLAHGIQMQLPAYLSVLRSLKHPEAVFGVKRLIPAGVFFINLRGKYGAGKSRRDVLGNFRKARALAYQHSGRFDLEVLSFLDSRKDSTAGDQFNYRLRLDGTMHRNCREPMESAVFAQLLTNVEGHLIRIGREIYSGNVRPDPFQKGRQKACDKCVCQSICRIDPWRHKFRVLTALAAAPPEEPD